MQPNKPRGSHWPPTEPDQPPTAHRGVPIAELYPQNAADLPDLEPSPEVKAPPPETRPPVVPSELPSRSWRQIIRANLSTIILLLLAPLIAWSISAFALQSYQVDGTSMTNTLQNNDRLIINKVPRTWSKITGHPYIPARGDIIIANTDPAWGLAPGEQIIKRVVGLPGEQVIVDGDKLTIINKDHPQGFNPDAGGHYTPLTPAPPLKVNVTLGSNELFVSGDNRVDSKDSRYFGPLPASFVIGKLVMRIMPLSKISTF